MHRRNLPAPIALPLLTLLTLLAPAGCIEEGDLLDEDTADDDDAEVDFRSAALENSGFAGGIYLNTNSLTRTRMFTLTTPNHTGTIHGHRLRAVDLPGSAMWNNNVHLTDQATGRIAFQTQGGQTVSGGGLNGTILKFDNNDDTTADVEVKINSEIYDDGAGLKGGPLYYYSVQTRAVGAATWNSLCGVDSWAVFADGDWVTDGIDRQSSRGDSTNGFDTITLSCLDGAIHKCIAQGKRPTDTINEQRHEACVRAITASYDEVAHTVTGMPIDLHESTGTASRFEILPEELPLNGDFVKEAEWGVEGATCVNRNALRRPSKVLGCPSDPAARTVANCVIVNPNTGVNVPECSSTKDYSTTFEYAGTVMASYSSKSASTASYDAVKDVYYGVETAGGAYAGKTMLFKGILKDSLQTITPLGEVNKLVSNGNGTYSLVEIQVDGLVYSETYSTMMGFEIDEANARSRLARIRPNGRAHSFGPWFDGIVRGAEINRTDSWIVTIVRSHPDPAYSNSKQILIAPGTGAVGATRNMVIWDANTSAYVPFNVSNGSDIARRPIYPGISREWYIASHIGLYSLIVNPQTINGQSVVVVDPMLRNYGASRFHVGLTYAHPTNNADADPNNDRMMTFDIDGTDELLFASLNAAESYGLTSFTGSVVPEREGINGDLASWVSRE